MKKDPGDAPPSGSDNNQQGLEEQKSPPPAGDQRVKMEEQQGQGPSNLTQHRRLQPEYDVDETKSGLEEILQILIKNWQQLRPSMTEDEFHSWLSGVPTIDLTKIVGQEALDLVRMHSAPAGKQSGSENPKKITWEPLVKLAKFRRMEEEKTRPPLVAPKKLWKHPWELLQFYWED